MCSICGYALSSQLPRVQRARESAAHTEKGRHFGLLTGNSYDGDVKVHSPSVGRYCYQVVPHNVIPALLDHIF